MSDPGDTGPPPDPPHEQDPVPERRRGAFPGWSILLIAFLGLVVVLLLVLRSPWQ